MNQTERILEAIKKVFDGQQIKGMPHPASLALKFYRTDIEAAISKIVGEWEEITDHNELPINELLMLGLYLRSGDFETWIVSIDEAFNVKDQFDDYVSEWNVDDFTYYKPLPQLPERKDKRQ